MRNTLGVLALSAVLTLSAAAQDKTQPGQPKVKIFGGGEVPKGAKIVGLDAGAGKAQNEQLRQELLKMVDEDQKGRREMIALDQKLRAGEDPEVRKQSNEVGAKLREVDRKNTARMK